MAAPVFPLDTYRFRDTRLDRRFALVLQQWSQHPEASIPAACGSPASTKACYRFLSSSHLDTAEIDAGTYDDTTRRADVLPLVLVAQDTTSVNYTTLTQTTGLGHIDQRNSQGLLMHSALCVSPDGLPLGVIDRTTWARPAHARGSKQMRKHRATSEKESYRWIATEQRVEARLHTAMVMIADREADLYDYIARPRRAACAMLIRWVQNRRTTDPEAIRLDAVVAALPVGLTAPVEVRDPATGNPAVVMMEYRWGTTTVQPPIDGLHAQQAPCLVTLIVVREMQPPAGRLAIEWRLMTTLPVHDSTDAQQYVRWYSYRWLIERLHYVLKSGCRIERLQLDSMERIDRALAMYTIVAWRLLFLTYQSRLAPDAPASLAFTRMEWEGVYCVVHQTRQPPEHPPSLKEMVRMVAGLGGFMGRKGDGDPGVTVLWRGMRRVPDIVATYQLFHPCNEHA